MCSPRSWPNNKQTLSLKDPKIDMRQILSLFCLSFLAGAAAPAADFPPISSAERSLTEVPGQPGAPAVVLFSRAELKIMDYPKEVSSIFTVQVRRKILTEEGKSYGEVEIAHSSFYRLKKIKGRTVLADGREVPLPEDAIFEERRSKSLKQFVTKLVFPAVEVGAILDYTYSVRWDNFFFLEPWMFQSSIPALVSEISFIKPLNIGLQPWVVQNRVAKVTTEVKKKANGAIIYLRGENLPGVPDEPFSFPFGDLSARAMMVPVSLTTSTDRIPLLKDWGNTVGFFIGDYKKVRRSDSQAKKQALALATGKSSLHEKLVAVFDFVRDEIRTDPILGVGISDEEKVDHILKERHGRPTGKALLLQSMLEGLKVDSDLIWAFDKTNGRADLGVANPWWFDTTLVRVMVDNQPIYLDPSDNSVAFGHLAPGYEGTQAIVVQKKKPPTITLPSTPFEQNQRRARVQLTVDEEGRVSGQGNLEFSGHSAWNILGDDDPEATLKAWTESLGEDYEDYDVTDVEVEEDLREQHVRVSWNLTQREEEVLGDEVTLQPAAPLGPITQPFTLPPEQRRTPVQMSYGRREDLLLTVTWPKGWIVDVLPQDFSHTSPVGLVDWRVSIDEGARKVEIQRRFDRSEYEFLGSDQYRALRDLYQQAAKADAQSLVLLAE
jgi:hypothetical protein